MIAKKVFTADGVNTRFLSDFIIQSEQFARVYAYIYDNTLNPNGSEDQLQNGSVDPADWVWPSNIWKRGFNAPKSDEDLLTIEKWDLVTNSILTYEIPVAPTTMWIEVATTAEEFGDTLTAPSVERAETAADNALASELAAAASETAAGLSETNAAASEVAAASSETNAAASETAAGLSETAAALSETNAAASETAAGLSETAAAASEAAAAISETNSAASEAAAALSETNAAASETNAAQSAADAAVSVSQSTKAESRNAVISSPNGVLAEDVTPTPSHYDRTYTGNGTSQDIVVGTGDGTQEITNGTFDTDIAGWASTGHTISWDAGRLKGVRDIGFTLAYQQLTGLTIGASYEVRVDLEVGTGTTERLGVRIGADTNGANPTYAENYRVGTGSVKVGFTATATTANVVIRAETTAGIITYADNVSVKEITNPASSESRPWVSAGSYTAGQYRTYLYIIYEALTTHSGVATTPDVDATNWVAIADGVSVDADNADVWIKMRASVTSNHYRFDSLRGVHNILNTDLTGAGSTDTTSLTSFNIDGFSIGSRAGVNGNTYTFVAWTEYFDKMFSFTTNHGKRGICAYNAQSGKFMVSYQGSGIAGHEIPHGVGTAPIISHIKNRDSIVDWDSQTLGYRLELNLNLAGATNLLHTFTDTSISLYDGNTIYNALNVNYISYGSSNRDNHSKIVQYTGTGVAGNEVDVGMDLLALDALGKNIKLVIKCTSTGGTSDYEWCIFDNSRPMDSRLQASTSGAELASRGVSLTNNGISLDLNLNESNGAGKQYLLEVTIEDFDNPNGGLTVTTDNKVTYAEGTDDTSGDLDTVETLTGGVVSLTAGTTNYIYADKGDVLGATTVKLLEGMDRVSADKWGVESPSDATLKTTDKHSDYASGTGVVSASGFTTSYFPYETFSEGTPAISPANFWMVASTTLSWLAYEMTEKRVLKSWRIKPSDTISHAPKRFTIEGSNDGVTWVAVDSTYTSADYTDITSQQWGALQTVSNTVAYKSYRVNITANNGDATYTGIGRLELNTEHPAGDFYNVPEGIMYSPKDVAINGTFDTDVTGWAVNSVADTLEWDTGRAKVTTNSGGFGYIKQDGVLTVNKEYVISAKLTGDVNTPYVYLGSNFAQPSYNIGDTYYWSLECTGHTKFMIRGSATAGNIVYIDDVEIIDKAGIQASRTYLGEVVVDGSGEIIPDTLQSYTVARKQVTDIDVHGDAVFHGGVDISGGINFNQSWQDVLSERILGVNYTNNTGKPIMVCTYPSATGTIDTYVDDLKIAQANTTTSVVSTNSVIVPPNSIYKVVLVTGSIAVWRELR